MVISAIISCSRKSKNNSNEKPEQNNIVAEVENGSNSSFRSGSYYDIVDALYFELIKNDAALKKLDEEYQMAIKNSSDALHNEDEILDKPKKYFQLVNSEISKLKDSASKNQLNNLVKNDFDLYKVREQNLVDKELLINKNHQLIDNAYFIFKVKKTLPEIKKYLKQNPENYKKIDEAIKEQQQLFQKMKNLK